MGRQPIRNKVPTVVERVPVEFRDYIIAHRKTSTEPLYMVFMRMLHYFRENKEDLFIESEQKTKAIEALTRRCREIERENGYIETFIKRDSV